MIELILNVSFMFSGCLGALDSNGIDDVVDHEYDTLPRVRYSHTWIFLNYWWPTVTISRFRVQFLINLHDQVNTSLGPRATKHSMMTPAQRQKAKVSRQLKAHKKKRQHQAQRSWGVFQARGKFRATKEETQVHVLEEQVHFWGTQFLKTPYGVTGTAGTRVSSIWKERSNKAGCSAC